MLKSNVERILDNPLIGFIFAPISIKMYNIITNQSPFTIHNYRFHHYQLGVVVLLWAILKKKPFFIGWGSGLIIDDLIDLLKDLNKFLKN